MTHFPRWTYSSAIVLSDGDDLGVLSDNGGGGEGQDLELDMDMDLLAPSMIDNDDDSIFGMTTLGE